jgi:hypothetical protein
MTKLLFAAAFLLQISLQNSYAQTSRNMVKRVTKKIAGIEVGSKGVKLSILEKSVTDNGDFMLLKDSSVNTDFISFTSASYDATLNAFAGLYNHVKDQWNILPEDIATLVSSGVKAQADKLGKNDHLQTFINAFKIKINEEGRQVEVISVLKESVLSHYGIIPDADRYNTFLIDIGSGNTKGGYFNGDTKEFTMFEIPSGTKSVTNLAEKNCGANCDFLAFKNKVPRVVDSIENSEIIYAVNASGAFPASTTMALSGGIAWAVASLLYPENTAQHVTVTYKDIVRFREVLINRYADIPDTNRLMMKGMPAENLSRIRKVVSRVINVFDTKSLLAGSTLLLRIMRQFESPEGGKKFMLVKNGQTGWITGYILKKDKPEKSEPGP